MALAPTHGSRPDHVWHAPSPARTVVWLVLVATVAGTVAGAWWGRQQGSSTLYVLACGAAVLAVGCWVVLQVTVPQRVSITKSVVEIKNGSTTVRYDLEDPGTDLLVRDGEVAFGHYRDNWSIVRARDVDWRPFLDVVMRFQSRADINAEERDRRFNA